MHEKFYLSLKVKLSSLKFKLPKPYSEDDYVFLDKNGKSISNNNLMEISIENIINMSPDGSTPSIYEETYIK